MQGDREILSRAVAMVRDFFFQELYKDWDLKALAEAWGMKPWALENLAATPEDTLSWHLDLVPMLRGSGFDLGLTIRHPKSGREVTFFPPNNFGGEEGPMEVVHEAIPHPQEREGLDFLPKVHEADGSYTAEEDVIEAEYEEIDARDIQELYLTEALLCENCRAEEQLPGSLLCNSCIQADQVGISRQITEDRTNEIIARIDREAEEAQRRSERRRRALVGDEEEEEGGDYVRFGEDYQEPSPYDPEVRKEYFDFGEEE